MRIQSEEVIATALSNEHYHEHCKATQRRRQQKMWERDRKKEMWIAGFMYSRRKTEVTAQDTARWRPDVWGLNPMEQ